MGETTSKPFWGVELGNGVVQYDDISFLPDDFDVRRGVDVLKEDMLQIALPDDVLIDVGWYPSFDEAGAFHVLAIKAQNWDAPVAEVVTREIPGVKEALRKLIANRV